jgi:putative RNA 2'-phosphotransferase
MSAKSRKSPDSLARFLAYVLGRAPHEFGLVLSPDGYVRIKSLLNVCSEEAGWRHVREGHIREAMLVLSDVPFEVSEGRIRARDRSHLVTHEPADHPPKLLYTHVRRKAYPHVAERGLRAAGDMPVVLSDDRDMAERIGRRRDSAPVCLVVNTARAESRGIAFWHAGHGLYTADGIPAGCFTGPPLPKAPSGAAPPKRVPPPERNRSPGSFELDFSKEFQEDKSETGRRNKEKKRRRQAPPWRR